MKQEKAGAFTVLSRLNWIVQRGLMVIAVWNAGSSDTRWIVLSKASLRKMNAYNKGNLIQEYIKIVSKHHNDQLQAMQ